MDRQKSSIDDLFKSCRKSGNAEVPWWLSTAVPHVANNLIISSVCKLGEKTVLPSLIGSNLMKLSVNALTLNRRKAVV